MLVIAQKQFDSLLAWLDSDRELAGRKYETIRAGLVRIFVSKGFNDAEDLADETINRVTKRLADIRDTYEGEPARYFHGVARNIVREARRRKEITTEVTAVAMGPPPVAGDDYECLEQCLRLLPISKRELILDYYLYEGHDKIEHHKRMAEQLRISEGALRGRAHHIKLHLKQVMQQLSSRHENENCSRG